jgi:DNA-directed RNA polymerase subunit RPC12/RpoP
METKIVERCIYCGGEVIYDSSQELVRCEWCSKTLMVAKFESEIARRKKTEEENILVRQKLAQAEKEKQAADDRLFAALSNLGEIRDSQDTLGKVVSKLTEGQGDALQSLEFLKGVSERLINTQNDIFGRMGVMQEIGLQLKKNGMAEQEFQSVMNEFMMWSQQIQKDDVQRLQEITEK